MTKYTESNHNFSFDEQWSILKYDDHPYYRILSGRSFSGIDFAGIFKQEQLYLMEVKNFYQYNNEGEISDVEQFILEIKEKILDTIDLANLIQKYHQRKWTYRLCIKLVLQFPSLNYDWWFWQNMFDLIQKKAMTFVLLIESTEEIDMLNSRILLSLAVEDYDIPKVHVYSLQEYNLPGVNITKTEI